MSGARYSLAALVEACPDLFPDGVTPAAIRALGYSRTTAFKWIREGGVARRTAERFAFEVGVPVGDIWPDIAARPRPALPIADLWAVVPSLRYTTTSGLTAPIGSLAAALGVHRRSVHRWQQSGYMPLTAGEAAAHALGLHPVEIWTDYHEVALANAAEYVEGAA